MIATIGCGARDMTTEEVIVPDLSGKMGFKNTLFVIKQTRAWNVENQ